MTDLSATTTPLIARVRAILLNPAEEWPVIAAEPDDTAGLFTRYALPLAAIGPVCTFLHGQLFGYGMLGVTWKPSLLGGLAGMVSSYVVALAGLYVLALIVDFVAPKFDGQAGRGPALKLVVHGATASFLAGFAQLLPGLGILGLLGLYSFYLFYTGATPLMKVPQAKALSFTAVTVVSALVVSIVAGAVSRPVIGLFGGAPGLSDSGEVSGKLTVPGMGAVDLDRMKAASAQMEADSKKPPIPAAQLQALLPAAIGAYQRTATESTGAGVIGSSAQGTYSAADRSFTLRIVDMAALGGIAGFGAALGVEQNKEDASGYEKTGTVDGHMQTEAWRQGDHNGKFGVVLGRFSIEAEGSAQSIDELKAAVAAIDPGKLASLGS
ncbi:Yip1 family protein [Novosphingobium bradum]|uniref:Yip1 family protein n=1 Tax=Novosphingobium bradum TaxID=1737444 RepID=A0ABV7IXI3_9SPHN